MNKFLPLALTFTTGLFSQITITSSSMPVSGDTIRYSNTNPTSVDVTQTGTNYYWNYDTLKSNSQGRYDYLAAYLTPYAFYFLGSGQYGLKTADSIGTGAYKFYNVYTFYKKTSSVFEAEGIGFKYNNIPLAQTYSDDDEIYSLPLTYLRHDSTTFKFTVTLVPGTYYSQVGYRINEVDGWGIIKTPYDSVACLRLVSTIYERDSINYSGIPLTFPNPQRQYKWISTTEHIPILEVDGSYNGSNFVPTQARYRDRYISVAAIAEINKEVSVNVFPNPTNSFIVVKTNYVSPAVVELYDLTGKFLIKTDMKQGVSVIDIKEIPAQLCSYRIINTEGKLMHTGKVLISK